MPAKNISSMDSVREAALAFQKIRILLSAYELGIFSALSNKAKTATEVAKKLKTDRRATERLMEALCALGWLTKNKESFSNRSPALRFLVKGRPEFMAGLQHVSNMWGAWSLLTETVRKGKSALAGTVDKRGQAWLEAFIAAMHERAARQAGSVVSLLDLSGVRSVLDVGAGSGAYAMAFARAKKGIRVTVFDLPQVIPLTKRYIKEAGFSKKIGVITGDYISGRLGKGFDLIFLSAVIHSNSASGNRRLLGKCVKALNPNGKVVIQDFIMDESRTRPVIGALFALNMLVATESGDTYTEAEVKKWMRQAGLSGIVRKNTPFGTSLIIGTKIK